MKTKWLYYNGLPLDQNFNLKSFICHFVLLLRWFVIICASELRTYYLWIPLEYNFLNIRIILLSVVIILSSVEFQAFVVFSLCNSEEKWIFFFGFCYWIFIFPFSLSLSIFFISQWLIQVQRPQNSTLWTLQIKYPQLRDAGTYECQINSEPKMSLSYTLNVIGKHWFRFCFLVLILTSDLFRTLRIVLLNV